MKLTNKLELCSIEMQRSPLNHRHNLPASYFFSYDNEFCIELEVSFECNAHTQSWRPIFNFGYQVRVKKSSNKKCTDSSYIREIDWENGKSTKSYFSDPESRKMVVSFIKRYIKNKLSRFSLPVIVRGPITNFMKTNYRYLEIDDLIQSLGYQKIVIPVSSMEGYKPLEYNIKDKDQDVYWFYSKIQMPESDYTQLLCVW